MHSLCPNVQWLLRSIPAVCTRNAALHCSRVHSPLPCSSRSFNVVPMVVENVPGGERAMDIWSLLLKKRIVFVQGEITDSSATSIIAQLLYLESVDKRQPVSMYINSPGGSVTAGLAIYDTMNYISTPVKTLVAGQACSMGSLLLSAGARGERQALPNAKVMLHQPHGGMSGQASDIEIQVEQLRRAKVKLIDIYVRTTGQSRDFIADRVERDFWLTAEDAVNFGLIDAVVSERE